MTEKPKIYKIAYGSGGIYYCRGVRALADLIHNLVIENYNKLTVTIVDKKGD